MKKTIARNDRMTLGTDKNGVKPLPLVTLGRLMPVLGLAAVLGPLAVQAQGTAAPAAVAVPAPAASSATPTSATPTAATTAKWGEGVLEREFLIKLRTFLETDPFDFKRFESAFGAPLEATPLNGPYSDGGWGIGSVRYVHPFGPTFNNRSRGGVYWSFNPSRNSSYLSMDFVKMPPAGKRDGDGLPCMTPELIKEVFAAKWVGTTTYTDFSPMYPGRLPYPIPANQIFRWLPDTSEEVFLVYQLNEICVPGLTAAFKKLPPHPATR
ncbi:MAG: hypothetical protein JNK28_02605 [Burkholderiaceae bacterium]|nr:hypothetical protein [Burkholderiaceae bacterium]